jgi:hypothetical protein
MTRRIVRTDARPSPARRPRLALVGALALGAAFGALSSALNAGDSTASEAASLVLGAGWAWAGLALGAGSLAATSAAGALAGALALVAATTAYYASDTVLRQEPFALYWPEVQQWWLLGAVSGCLLGLVGTYIPRPGLSGLLARLALPAGAAAQMIILPPRAGDVVGSSTANWMRIIVLAAASVFAAAAVAGYAVRRR